MCAVAGEGEKRGEEGEVVDVSALQSKLSDYRDIIGRQEELLQVYSHGLLHVLCAECVVYYKVMSV